MSATNFLLLRTNFKTFLSQYPDNFSGVAAQHKLISRRMIFV